MKLHTRQLTCAAIVGAAYAVLSIFGSVFGITYGPIQCRFSEALCVLPFLLPDGSCDLTPCPKRNLPVFARFGIRADGTRQSTPEMEVFPVEYFCPVAYAGSTCDITPNTYSIHHYHASWKEKSRAMRFDEEVMEPLLGAKFYYRYYRPFRRALGARRKKWRT